MCGICGMFNTLGHDVDVEFVESMKLCIAHRGPDDDGLYQNGCISLGHQRLSILDLSEAARQPLSGEDGTVQAVCNGEIYNHKELRRDLELKGHRFISNTDSEVIPHAYEEWGLSHMVERLKGMFAIAIWDDTNRSLILIRDRLGVKPLYYKIAGPNIIFASELQALYPHSSEKLGINLTGLESYLSFGYVHQNDTFVSGFERVRPGSYVVFEGEDIIEHKYWSVPVTTGAKTGYSESEHLDNIDDTLRRAVVQRLESDVPTGIFLSGGIDSGLITAIASANTDDPINTFTVEFADSPMSDVEVSLSSKVAEIYGTNHHVLRTDFDSISKLPYLIYLAGEPFADPSILPTYQMCKIAKQSTTVVLTGDGGDESFCGYQNVHAAHISDTLFGWVPKAVRSAASSRANSDVLKGIIPNKLRTLLKYAGQDYISLYNNDLLWQDLMKDRLLIQRRRDTRTSVLIDIVGDLFSTSNAETLAYIDMHLRLPSSYLAKTDIASNAVALEIRSPFLDQDVVQYASSIPIGERMPRGIQKGLLRKLAARYLPREIVQYPKKGFAPPISQWLLERWRPVIDEFVIGGIAIRSNMFNGDVVREIVDDHLDQKAENALKIWQLVCLEVWLRLFVDKSMKPTDDLL